MNKYDVNRLPKQDVAGAPTGCCPKFDPEAWDGQTFHFDNKLFLKTSTRSFMHIPLNMGAVMKRAMHDIDAVGAGDRSEYILLSYEVSPWKAEHYISVKGEVPAAEMVRLSGTYLAKVFEGPFKNAATWHKEMVDYVRTRGFTAPKIYFFYTTCPRCARVYGKNYVVGFAQVDVSAAS